LEEKADYTSSGDENQLKLLETLQQLFDHP